MRFPLPLVRSASAARGPGAADSRSRPPVSAPRLGARLGSALAAAVFTIGCSATPDSSPLQADTEVLIDTMGIPHIYAKSDADAFFASGYTMARMRLFQMEMVRRQALGTAAEILGEAAVRGDLLARTFQFAEYGRQSRAAVQSDYPEDAALIESFVHGINLYIARVREGVIPPPAEMGPDGLNFLPTAWTLDDPYIVGKLLSFGLSSSLDNELLATALPILAPQFPRNFPLSMPTRNAFTVPEKDEIAALVPARATTPAPRWRPRLHRHLHLQGPAAHSPRPALPPAWAEALARFAPLSPPLASNNWAVAGKHTANGRPMLCGDPHQPLGSPSRFFAQHLNSADSGGTLDVVGFGFTGTPGVQLGHNHRVAWTATTNFADVMDLWEATTAGDQVIVGGKPRPARVRHEHIRVRAAIGPVITDDQAGDSREFVITDVPGFGVLLPEDLLPVPRGVLSQSEILVNWTGLSATHEAAMYLGLDRASSLDQWELGAKRLEVGAVNLVGADQGSIRYRVHANVPDRGSPSSGIKPWLLMSGTDPRSLWTGRYLTEDSLPSARDPERGYLTTANNDPWGFTKDGRVDNDPFYYGYLYDPGDRAARIESELQRLIARGKLTPADMADLQGDARSTLADDLLPPLAEAVAAIGTDPALAPYRTRPELIQLFAQLSTWDRQMRRDSAAAVSFFALCHFAAQRALADDLGPMLPVLFQADPGFAFKPLRLALQGVAAAQGLLQEGKRVILVAALADAADWLKTRFGTVLPTADKPYAWKDVHSAEFNHILGGKWNGGAVAVDGSVGTVNVSSSALLDGGGKPRDHVAAHAGSLYRMIASFDDTGTPQALVNFARGNDENPQSAFYSDQQSAWADNKHRPLLFKRTEIDKNTARKFTLQRDGSVKE